MKTSKTRRNYTLAAPLLKAAVSPVDFYRAELLGAPAWKRGAVWVDGGLCPFHADRNTGSFRVNLDTGAFKCFSCGSIGADILAFAMQRDRLSFPEALEKLSREWGL